MGNISESVKTVNSVLRTLIIGAFVAVVTLGAWFGYSVFVQPLMLDRQKLDKTLNELTSARKELEQSQQDLAQARIDIAQRDKTIEEQTEKIEALIEQVDKLETSIRLLKIDHRLAQIKVLSIDEDPESNQPRTTVSLQEIDSEGNPIGEARKFTIRGRNIYVDFWLAKFEDKYIEESDLLRSTTLCMFKSIYGELEAPADATPIEKPWIRPEAYASGSKMSEFEKKIWQDFWTIANDSTKSRELGIRANHGQAVYVKAEEGKTYLIQLRASDGLTFKTLDSDQSGKPDTPTPQG